MDENDKLIKEEFLDELTKLVNKYKLTIDIDCHVVKLCLFSQDEKITYSLGENDWIETNQVL